MWIRVCSCLSFYTCVQLKQVLSLRPANFSLLHFFTFYTCTLHGSIKQAIRFWCAFKTIFFVSSSLLLLPSIKLAVMQIGKGRKEKNIGPKNKQSMKAHAVMRSPRSTWLMARSEIASVRLSDSSTPPPSSCSQKLEAILHTHTRTHPSLLLPSFI